MLFFYISVHFVFIPQPVYDGPEFITYFRGPHLKVRNHVRLDAYMYLYLNYNPGIQSIVFLGSVHPFLCPSFRLTIHMPGTFRAFVLVSVYSVNVG